MTNEKKTEKLKELLMSYKKASQTTFEKAGICYKENNLEDYNWYKGQSVVLGKVIEDLRKIFN